VDDINNNKWSKNSDERPHRRGRIFHGGQYNVTPASREHCIRLQHSPLMIKLSLPLHSRETPNVFFSVSRTTPKLPLPVVDLGPHLVVFLDHISRPINGISIDLAAFAQLTRVPAHKKTRTDTHMQKMLYVRHLYYRSLLLLGHLHHSL